MHQRARKPTYGRQAAPTRGTPRQRTKADDGSDAARGMERHAKRQAERHDDVNVGSAWQSWVGVLFVNLVYGLINPGIALSAHVGGLVCGIVLGLIFFSNKHMRLA